MAAFLPSLVILMRHAEKTGRLGDSGLSALGEARARALAADWPGFLGGDPDALIACRSTPKSTRPVDTVQPLAQRLGLAINDRWGTQDYAAVAAAVGAGRAYESRRVLICWRHDALPQLAASFGVAAPMWPDDLYDVFWLLEDNGGALRLRIENQQIPIVDVDR